MLTADRPTTTTMTDAALWRRRLAGRLPDLLLLGLLVVAAVIRLRRLMEVPTLTDEADEVLRGLAIAQGRAFPLVNDDAYIGALFNYLVAGLFLIGGPNPVTPRLLALVAGLGTIVLTDRLGRQLGGRWTGLLAAALLTTAGLHIIINSRVAWSHSLTPFFTTAALVSLLAARRRGGGGLLVLTGLLAGLAVQTHPSAVALLPALAVASLLHPRGRAWLRRPWPYLAVAAAMLAVANLLVYNLVVSPLAALREAAMYTYAYQPKTSLAAYLAALPSYATDLVRAVGSVYRARPAPAAYLSDPAFVVAAALLIGGLLLALWRRQWLLPLTLLGATLLLPFFGRQFGFLPGDVGRYLAYLLPVAFALIAAVVVALAGRAWGAARRLPPLPGRRAVQVAVVGLTISASLALVWFPLRGALAFEETYPRRYDTALLVATVAAVAAQADAVYIDEQLNRVTLFGGGQVQLALIYLLDLRALPYRSLRVPPTEAAAELAGLLRPGVIVVLHEENVAALAPLRLEPLFVVTGPLRRARVGYGAYRIGPRPR